MHNKKIRFKKAIAKEGLIFIAIGIIIYFIVLYSGKSIPVIFPKYKAEFANGKSYIIEIYPDINYADLNTKKLLEKSRNPSDKVISKRIEEFAKGANIKAALKKKTLVNSGQLRFSEAYYKLASRPLPAKTLFIYLLLLLIRFVIWAIKTLKIGK